MTQKIDAIKKELKETDIMGIDKFIDKHTIDLRQGVIKLVKSARKKKDAYKKELDRTESMRIYENSYVDHTLIAGIDEVGRGSLAGPVVTAAVILPEDCQILYINDSKKVSQKRREELYKQIMEEAVAVSIGIESVAVIDEINILQATYRAMQKAVKGLKVQPSLLLVDAVTIPDLDIKQVAIIKGDEKSLSIAATSIVAKVTRDRMMVDYEQLFPGYGFARNKGYGVEAHIKAIKTIGPCPIHRSSFIKHIVKA